MVTPEDIKSIKSAVERATRAIDCMYDIANLLLSNKDELSDAIPTVGDEGNKNSFRLLESIPKRLVEVKFNIQQLEKVDQNISDSFSTFLQKEFIAYGWESIAFTDNRTRESIKEFTEKQKPFKINPNDINTVSVIKIIPDQYSNHLSVLEAKISALLVFQKISNIVGNIVMIGSNGSGKSTLSRQLRGKFSSGRSLTILSAQHLLTYSPKDSIPASTKELQRVRDYHSRDKLIYDNYSAQNAGSDMNQLISALIALHIDTALGFYNSAGSNPQQNSLLKRTIELWEYLVGNRTLKIQRSGISVVSSDGTEYQFNNLSDGEKAIFYYIGHILLAEESTYIIVDEPENHLHASICSKLWDILEKERRDCSFVYLTHDLDFATSRIGSSIIWNKSFIPPNDWDFEILKGIDDIPDSMLLSLVGSKRNICFCEGEDKSSIDYKLYNLLFPDYNVIPVGGHEQVIAYTSAYNKNTALFHHKAVGIIDGDSHTHVQVDEWAKRGIFTIETNEVENILCDEMLIDASISRFCSSKTAKQSYMELFWQEFENSKESQALKYTKETINNSFRSNCLKETRDIEKLKSELKMTMTQQSVDVLYDERITQLEKTVEESDYEAALRITGLKKALTRSIACKTIVDNYEERALSLLGESGELLDLIRGKYFSGYFEEMES